MSLRCLHEVIQSVADPGAVALIFDHYEDLMGALSGRAVWIPGIGQGKGKATQSSKLDVYWRCVEHLEETVDAAGNSIQKFGLILRHISHLWQATEVLDTTIVAGN